VSRSLKLIRDQKKNLKNHEDNDVFVCYRGLDVKIDFVDYLEEALSLSGFKVYVDSKDVSKGEVA